MKTNLLKNIECIFCKIVKKEAPSYKFWEDEKHIAFLSIYPNTPGATVVIPKEHYTSDVLSLPEDVLSEMTIAASKVAKIINDKLPGVGRTALVYEGFGVDHAHAKLFPMHGTQEFIGNNWQAIKSNNKDFFETYPGYISSHDCNQTSKQDLEEIFTLLGGTLDQNLK